MRIEADIPDSRTALQAVLSGFVAASAAEIAAGLVPPFPDDAGIRFEPEASGSEQWKLPHQTLRDGAGDCEDLAVWEAAGWRVTGQDPGAQVVLAITGPKKLHAVVRLSDGTISDPSLRARARAAQRDRLAVLGGVVIRDRRKAKPPDPKPGAPPPAAAPGTYGPAPDVTPQQQAAMDAMAALNAEMERRGQTRGNMHYHGNIDPSLVRDSDRAMFEMAQRAGAAIYEAQQTRPNIEAQRMAIEIRASKGITAMPDPATWGVSRRTDPTWQPGGEFIVDEATGAYRRPRRDPLAELPQTPQAPWGGGYGSDYGYGGDYGYGYPMGWNDGYPMDGGSAYGWWHDGPLMTYADLYGTWEEYGSVNDTDVEPYPELDDEEEVVNW